MSRGGYKKHHRGKFSSTVKGTEVIFGDFGLVSLSSGELKDRCFQSMISCLKKQMKDKGKIFLRAVPDYSVTKKPVNMKMGGGSGKVDHLSMFVRKGKVLLEISGLNEENSMNCLRIAMSKASLKLAILKRRV